MGKNGAPAATPNSRRPTPSGSSSPSARASTKAATGIITKFASSDIATRRILRSGAVISATLSPNPIANMLDTTKTTVAIGTALSSTPVTAVLDLYSVRTPIDSWNCTARLNGVLHPDVHGAVLQLPVRGDDMVEIVARAFTQKLTLNSATKNRH